MMLALAMATLALAPLLSEGIRWAIAKGGSAQGAVVALDAWVAVIAVGVVLFDVLPEAFEALGVMALGIAAGGAWFARIAHDGGGDRWVGIAALIGLSAHSAMDGVAITGTASAGVGVAVAAHNVPAGVAVWRAAGVHAKVALGLALAGTLAGGLVGHWGMARAEVVGPVLAAVQCVVAGSILHIVTHSSATAAAPTLWGYRAVGAVVGLGVVVAGAFWG